MDASFADVCSRNLKVFHSLLPNHGRHSVGCIFSTRCGTKVSLSTFSKYAKSHYYKESYGNA